jgi:hypothetical protein
MSDDARTSGALPDDELDEITAQIADHVRGFLVTVQEVAEHGDVESGAPLLLLALSQLVAAGGRLGALADVVPEEPFEPDAGWDPDVDKLRERLAEMFGDSDEYVEVFDPYDIEAVPVRMRLSSDLTEIASHLVHGLQHVDAGGYREGLWWWQFSYLSSWGATATSTLRAVYALIAHDRFDAREVTLIDVEDQLLVDTVTASVGEVDPEVDPDTDPRLPT